MAENKIYSLRIDTSTVPTTGTSRAFTVKGDVGAGFLLQVVNGSGNFYNFRTQEFTGGTGGSANTFSVQNVLRVKMKSDTYSSSIYLPSSTATTYNVMLMPNPGDDTEIAGSKQVINKTLTQVANSTVTFAVATATSNYSSSPAATNVTTTGSSASSSSTAVDADYTVTNVSNDSYGFGLRLIRQPIDTDWYFTTTETVNGTISSATDVVVDDLTDLIAGMYVTGVSSGSLSGTPTILSIDTATKTLTLSAAQSFNDGITLTFQARGEKRISSVLGFGFSFSQLQAKVTDPKVTTTVRGAISNSTTITVDGTYGISGGSVVTFDGAGVDNSSTNNVNVVTASSSAGQFTCDVNQTLTDETTLTFTGSSSGVIITADIVIHGQYPTVSREIYLNLDNFITPGVSGA